MKKAWDDVSSPVMFLPCSVFHRTGIAEAETEVTRIVAVKDLFSSFGCLKDVVTMDQL